MPSILMMVFTSIYGVVDGFFVSNYAGKAAFAAVNFIMPFLMIVGELGFMVGAGGCALIGLKLGEGRKDEANGIFSMLVYFTIFSGIIIAIIGFFTAGPVAMLLGADEEMVSLCKIYAQIGMAGLPAVMLQFEFHSFCPLAEKPKLGLYVTLAAGIMNMILDWLFVGVFRWGIAGASWATVASQFVGGVVPLVFFLRKNDSLLMIGKPLYKLSYLGRTLFNGLSEFVSGISMSLVGMVFNSQLMRFLGEDGVAAYGILMYVNFIFIAVFIGYAVGTAPVVSYHYGAGNKAELHGILVKSIRIITITAIIMLLCGELLAKPLSGLFVSYDAELMDLTIHAFRIFSFVFLFAAIPIYGSSFFTALNDGLTSAAISFLRTVVFELGAVILLPMIMGVDGIWYSCVFAEIVAAALTVFFWIIKRKKFGY